MDEAQEKHKEGRKGGLCEKEAVSTGTHCFSLYRFFVLCTGKDDW